MELNGSEGLYAFYDKKARGTWASAANLELIPPFAWPMGDPLIGQVELTHEEFARRWRRCGIAFEIGN